MDLLTLVGDFGPLVALIVYFVWRDAQREKHHLQVIEGKDRQIRDQQLITAEMTNSLARLTARCEDALHDNQRVVQALLDWLKQNADTDVHRKAIGPKENER